MRKKPVTVSHIREPFGEEVTSFTRPAGTRLSATKPETKDLLICRVNGGPKYLPRSEWDRKAKAGDIVEWVTYPAGNDDDAGILQIALAFVASVVTLNPTPFLLVLATNIGSVFTDISQTPDQLKVSPTYSTGLQGNQARLYSAVPKICGRHQTFPPFASQPYNEFDDAGEQYLYVILALGIGNHAIERVLIDDTDINHFNDVLTTTYLPPGTQPAAVLTNVINSPEVANQEMLTGERIGGFAACAPRVLASAIGIDVVAPQGIGLQDSSGNVGSLLVSWIVEIRSINQFGSALTPWTLLATETRTAADREPQRWSYKYELTTPIRPEIRVTRTDPKSSNARALNDLVWSGMRAYLDGDAGLNPEVAHFEVVMRSSKQLSGASQNRISVIATGMCRDLNSDLTWGAEIATRNAALWLADLWTSATWGEGLSDSQVDLQTLYSLKVLWDARQDRFDYVFDSAMDADAAAQLIAESGRARCFRRGGVRTLSRDQLVTLPRTAFSTRNTTPGSMMVAEELPRDDMPDGVIMEYWDNRSWNFGQPIECPCPGVTTMQRPLRIRKAGVTGSIHATREGLYEAAKLALRRQTVGCTTEMQGAVPAYGATVRWQSEVTRWQSGDVVEWDDAALVARLTEPPNWGDSALYIVFIADDGTPTEPIEVIQGDLTTEVILASAPSFDPSTEDGTRDRTQYLLGGLADDEMLVKITAKGDGGDDGGAKLYKISGVVDDARVHSADNAYLPSPGEIQDPIDTSPGDPGGGTLQVVTLTNHEVISSDDGGPAEDPTYTLRNDGRCEFRSGTGFGSDTTFPEFEWLFETVEASIAAQFEVRATYVYSGYEGLITGPTFDVWHSLGTTRQWSTAGVTGTVGIAVRIEIRDIATLTIQDSAIITIGHLPAIGGGD